MEERVKRALEDLTTHKTEYITGRDQVARPWSFDDYCRRVKTFSLSTWFAKPSCVDPLECARFGWVNCSADMLECEVCKNRISFGVASSLDHYQKSLIVQELKNKLVNTAHKDICPWKDNPCSPTFARLPLQPLSLVSNYVSRVQHILSDPDPVLPVVTHSFLQLMDLEYDSEQDVLVTLVQIANISSSVDRNRAKVACMLALCGWDLEETTLPSPSKRGEKPLRSLRCQLCQREVGLWNFLSLQADEEIRPTKRARTQWLPDSSWAVNSKSTSTGWGFGTTIESIDRKTAEPPKLDPLAQHRWFCPWTTAAVSPSSNTSSSSPLPCSSYPSKLSSSSLSPLKAPSPTRTSPQTSTQATLTSPTPSSTLSAIPGWKKLLQAMLLPPAASEPTTPFGPRHIQDTLSMLDRPHTVIYH